MLKIYSQSAGKDFLCLHVYYKFGGGQRMATKRIYINNEPTAYLAYDDGRIYSEHTNKFLKPFTNPSGYYLVDLHHKHLSYTRQLHRVIASLFIPNPNKWETVNHKDGNKANNSVDNLEWMTLGDNVRHAWKTGLAKPRCGVKNPANRYTEDQIHWVCKLLEMRKLNNTEIARICDVNVTTIRDIKFRGKWRSISKLYDIPTVPRGHKELRNAIMQMIDEGYTNDMIMHELNMETHADRRHIDYVRQTYRKSSLND